MEQPLDIMGHFMSVLKCEIAGYNCVQREVIM
jgi:hypothetical protein